MGKFTFDWDGVKNDIKKEEEKRNSNKKWEKDERFWEVTREKGEKATVILRFLPDPSGVPFVKYYAHGFKYQKANATKWFIKNCLNTFGWEKGCPICAKNNQLWKSPFQSDKDLAREMGRKVNYVSNVLVIQDKNNPEAEGNVYLFRYGQKIFDMIKALMFPSEDDMQDPDFVSFVPFDLYEGANFTLKVKQQGDHPNYDDSKFSKQSGLFNGDDKKIAEVMGKVVALAEFTLPEKFPTNEVVLRELNGVNGIGMGEGTSTETVETVEDDGDGTKFDFEEKKEEKKETKKKATAPPPVEESAPEPPPAAVESDDDTDDDMEFFRKIK